MSLFNNYMGNHFSACRLVAYAHDNCRNRDVSLFMIPGQVEVCGVSDGVDAWIAPLAADPFSVDIQRLFADIYAGKEIAKPIRIAPKTKRIAFIESTTTHTTVPIKRSRLSLDHNPHTTTRKVSRAILHP